MFASPYQTVNMRIKVLVSYIILKHDHVFLLRAPFYETDRMGKYDLLFLECIVSPSVILVKDNQ